jgi:quinol monooxygenase YgiN
MPPQQISVEGDTPVYARLVRFGLGTGNHVAAQALADDLAPQISAQPGCHGVTVFGNAEDGEYGIFVLWDSQASADAASAVIRPKLNEHLSGKLQAPPDARLFEVLSNT